MKSESRPIQFTRDISIVRAQIETAKDINSFNEIKKKKSCIIFPSSALSPTVDPLRLLHIELNTVYEVSKEP